MAGRQRSYQLGEHALPNITPNISKRREIGPRLTVLDSEKIWPLWDNLATLCVSSLGSVGKIVMEIKVNRIKIDQYKPNLCPSQILHADLLHF